LNAATYVEKGEWELGADHVTTPSPESEEEYPVRQRRLPRSETRRRVLDAAARVFARRGLEGASIEEVAAAAGFSKGAVYSNFASKDDLVFALMEREINSRVERVLATAQSEPTAESQWREAGHQLSEVLGQSRDWQLLFIEFWLRAVRDPRLREQFAARRAPLRKPIARLFEAQAAALGISGALPAEQLAVAVLALSNGLAIEQLADPEAVPPETFGLILTLLLRGLRAEVETRPIDYPLPDAEA
jgi:AcrR family transcriptional regulator